jgi:hypothetical protein
LKPEHGEIQKIPAIQKLQNRVASVDAARYLLLLGIYQRELKGLMLGAAIW